MDRECVEQAVRSFVALILSGPAARHVLKIVHFGSTTTERFDDASDVDLLVVSSDHGPAREHVAAAAFCVQMETGVGLEPIVEALDDVSPVTDYFHLTVFRRGREVFSVDPERLKEESRSHLVSLAGEYLQASRDALSRGHVRLSLDGGYNALELSLKAMILTRRDDLPSSHGGIVGAFGEEFVKTGRFGPEIGRRINQALQLRNSARYKYQAVIRESDAEEVLDLAAELLEACRP